MTSNTIIEECDECGYIVTTAAGCTECASDRRAVKARAMRMTKVDYEL